jgi:hypothetical protein
MLDRRAFYVISLAGHRGDADRGAGGDSSKYQPWPWPATRP